MSVRLAAFIHGNKDENGSVIAPEVLRGIEPSIDKEAVRVIQTQPKWGPGELRGNKVRVRYRFPIHIDFR